MHKDFDNFTENLQKQILPEVKDIYGEKALDRWVNPLYMGIMDEPDGHACITGKCGDTMEIFLRFSNDRIERALYLTDGCRSSNLCGSVAAELAHGRSPDELTEINGEAIIQSIGELPEQERHCATLASETLQEALHDYMLKQRNSKGRTS